MTAFIRATDSTRKLNYMHSKLVWPPASLLAIVFSSDCSLLVGACSSIVC
jgi:hypothetical protein